MDSKKKINLIVLATREGIANCRVLETGEKILLRLYSYQLFKIAPGEISTVGIKKIWEFGGSKYISGELIDHQIKVELLGLKPLKLTDWEFWDPAEEFEEERDEDGQIIEEADDYFKAIINVGMKIWELSLPEDFNGVLLWSLIDNRPFLRCMHGYGLCLWKLKRFEEAEKVFEQMLWLNPPDNQGVRFIIYHVKDRKPWREDY